MSKPTPESRYLLSPTIGTREQLDAAPAAVRRELLRRLARLPMAVKAHYGYTDRDDLIRDFEAVSKQAQGGNA